MHYITFVFSVNAHEGMFFLLYNLTLNYTVVLNVIADTMLTCFAVLCDYIIFVFK